MFAFYALSLFAEFVVVGAFFVANDVPSNFLFYLACVLPAACLFWLVRRMSGPLAILTCAALAIGTLGGAALNVYALHLAPPDGQNAIVVAMVALYQLAAFIVLALVALVTRLVRRRSVLAP